MWGEVRFLKFSEESESAGDIFYPWMAFLTANNVIHVSGKFDSNLSNPSNINQSTIQNDNSVTNTNSFQLLCSHPGTCLEGSLENIECDPFDAYPNKEIPPENNSRSIVMYPDIISQKNGNKRSRSNSDEDDNLNGNTYSINTVKELTASYPTDVESKNKVVEGASPNLDTFSCRMRHLKVTLYH